MSSQVDCALEGSADGPKNDEEVQSPSDYRAYFDFWNQWVERNGLPLARYRMF